MAERVSAVVVPGLVQNREAVPTASVDHVPAKEDQDRKTVTVREEKTRVEMDDPVDIDGV